MTWPARRCLLGIVLLAAACAHVRVTPRDPTVPAEVAARIAGLGCGDTAAAPAVLALRAARAARDSFVVVRDPHACAELLDWMARWTDETFEAWTTPQTGFLLLRAGPLLHVYRWQWRAARADSARTLGPGLVMDVDLRRQGQGITGWSF